MALRSSVLTLALLAGVALLTPASAYHGCDGSGPCERDKQILDVPELTEDFQFEVRNVYTNRQRGARLNIFIKFRYYTNKVASYYSTETGTFDYRDLNPIINEYLPAGGGNLSRDVFWEVVNREMSKAIWRAMPIQGLSVRLEVQGMSSGGIASHRASTVTMGNMEPWYSMTNNFPGCDGMSTTKGNRACAINPTWSQDDDETKAPTLSPISDAKAGKHDKPTKCDTCA
ncbi:hypothetical protein HYH03_007601 [Edaphochlamys debaryana]|uniref:Uncharacterized protein n=1 Tax=Edaphochlamys debaryana TaxID=47281 RepID=A0A836BYV9_9CHLO|nr:hypothetical protein HYH03_007601 [Edaphochlamys debaryana]|eukprot:KAG2494246.1 hypothetical protein HYH03_007601 [Edaphochlamys debaryana]